MATPVLAQSAANSVCKYQSRSCTASFTDPTSQGNLIVLTAVAGGGNYAGFSAPPGFVKIRDVSEGNLNLAMWYYQGAPPMNSVTVSMNRDRSLHVRVLEYSGAAQSNALDQVSVLDDDDDSCYTGQTGITKQADEVVVSVIANSYASCSQSGFSGGLVKLFEAITPQYYGWYQSNDDWERVRCTHHHTISRDFDYFHLRCSLSSWREWAAIIATFRGGTSGPKRMSSKTQKPAVTTGGRGELSAFGPLKSVTQPGLSVAGSSGTAIIGPFDYQYRINGWTGLLIGSGTSFSVESSDGLGGWQVRTSDSDLPRGDGALRGIDLESARQVVFKLNVGQGRDDTERNMDTLLRALVPQRDADWELIWRHPTQPLKMMRVRPTDLTRQRDAAHLLRSAQSFALRAADPRHYSAISKTVNIPVTVDPNDPTIVRVVNEGNVPAYPIITITGPSSGPAITQVQLVNTTALVTFAVSLTLATGSTLVGDMDARITGAPRSIITLDGQSKYGSWQLPRDPFRIDPDPAGLGGYNQLYLRTTPEGAPVTCSIQYRDTWGG